MKKSNLNYLKNQLIHNKTHILLEVLICFSFVCSLYFENNFFKGMYYITNIIIQLIILYYIKKLEKKLFYKYIILILILIFLACIFIIKGINFVNIIIRILTLLAFFGVIIFKDKKLKNIRRKIFISTIKILFVFSFIINLDFFSFCIIGKCIWHPIYYLGYRVVGPFGDPNFLALYTSVAFLSVFYDKKNFKYRKIMLVTFFISILLANSLSSFLILFLTTVIQKFKIISDIGNRKKVFFILFFYFTILFIYKNFAKEISEISINLLEILYGNLKDALIKYKSLELRFETQLKALEYIFEDCWGKGPKELVPQLGLDTHNSYLGIIFEQGILGIILIFITLDKKVKKKSNKYVGTYLFISSLLLNVHLTSIYSFYLIIQSIDE